MQYAKEKYSRNNYSCNKFWKILIMNYYNVISYVLCLRFEFKCTHKFTCNHTISNFLFNVMKFGTIPKKLKLN